MKLRIGDKVKFLIVENGIMKMVEGEIFEIHKQQVLVSYEGSFYRRTIDQIERMKAEE